MGRRTRGAADREEWAADRSGQRTNCPESGPGRKAPHLSSLSGAVAPLRTDGPGQSIAAHPAGGTHRRPRTLVLHSIYNETEGVEWREACKWVSKSMKDKHKEGTQVPEICEPMTDIFNSSFSKSQSLICPQFPEVIRQSNGA